MQTWTNAQTGGYTLPEPGRIRSRTFAHRHAWFARDDAPTAGHTT